MRVKITDNSTPMLAEYKMIVAALNGAVTTMVAREAFMLSNNIKGGLFNQSPGGKRLLPLKQSTIKLRGIQTSVDSKPGSKALIHTGSLVNSVKARKVSSFHYTAGVHRNARNKKGKSLSDIALIHENGTRTYTVTVTEKMRRFSFVLMRFGLLQAPWRVGQKLTRKIPPRPFLNPAHDFWEKDAENRFALGLAAILGVPM